MKKEYKKPMAEIIEFIPEECLMNDQANPDDDEYWGGSGVDDDFS